MKNQITTKQIFEANQVLTISLIPSLVGKKIAVTNGEYKYNTPDVRMFTLLGYESQFDAAAKNAAGKYESQQSMWIAENNTKETDVCLKVHFSALMLIEKYIL